MTSIPPELRKLWADRNRKPSVVTHDEESVLMTFKDGEDPNEPFKPVAETRPLEAKTEPLLNETAPIRDVKLFPTYKIGPQPVDLANFDYAKRKRE